MVFQTWIRAPASIGSVRSLAARRVARTLVKPSPYGRPSSLLHNVSDTASLELRLPRPGSVHRQSVGSIRSLAARRVARPGIDWMLAPGGLWAFSIMCQSRPASRCVFPDRDPCTGRLWAPSGPWPLAALRGQGSIGCWLHPSLAARRVRGQGSDGEGRG